MTWGNAVAEAHRRIAMLPIPPAPAPLDGLVLRLQDFETDAVAAILCGGNSADFQRMVNRAVLRTLRKRGAKVEVETVSFREVLTWNSPMNSPQEPMHDDRA
jgi:hypothetical protein